MSKEQKIVFRNGSAIECLPAGETVRGHRAELPFLKWDIANLSSDDEYDTDRLLCDRRPVRVSLLWICPDFAWSEAVGAPMRGILGQLAGMAYPGHLSGGGNRAV